jgi:hypothetical protein
MVGCLINPFSFNEQKGAVFVLWISGIEKYFLDKNKLIHNSQTYAERMFVF